MKRLQGLTFIGMSDILGTGISAIFWFFLATLVEPDGYGSIFYFLSIAGVVSIASPIATQYVITVYSAKHVTIRSTLFTLSIISAIVGASISFVITQRIDVSLLILGYVAFNLASGKLLGERKIKQYAITNLIQKSLTPILGFYFIFGIEAILIGLALTYVLHFFIILKEIRFTNLEFKEIKTRSKFIIFNYGNNIAGLFGGQVDKIIIGTLYGFTLLGNYSLSMQIVVAMMAIPNIIFKYLLTEELYGVKDREFKKKIIVFCSIITIAGFFLVPEIVPKIFPKYLEVNDAIRIMSIAILPTAYAKIQTVRYLSQERSHIIFGGSGIYFITLLIGIIFLGSIWGIVGIAVSFLLSSINQVIGHTILNQKLK